MTTRTLLIVEDSNTMRELIKVYLIAKDVKLVDASDGVEALTRIREERPDLVIADLRMPRLDGEGLCRAMGADPSLRAIPVVILTSDREEKSARRCLDAGAREVLRKPIQPGPLLAAINRHLQQKQ